MLPTKKKSAMKEEAKSPKIPAMGFLAKATTSVLLLSLGYTLGLLSSYASSPPSSNTHLLIHVQSQATSSPASNSTAIEHDNSSSSSTPRPPPPHDLFLFRMQCSEPIASTDIRQTIIDQLYDGVSPYSGFPAASTVEHLLPPRSNPRGWGSTTPVFHDLIAEVRPRTIIELGTFLGASALHMAALTRNLSLTSTQILCIDDFRSWPNARRLLRRDLPVPLHADALLLPQFMLAVKNAGEEDRILPLPFSTSSTLRALCEWGVYGDLIEVDAGHDFHSAWADINMAWAVLRPGGVIFGHDYFTKADNMGVRRAVTLFAKVKGLKVRPHGQHWVLSPKPNSSP